VVFSTILGFIVWHEVPDSLSLAGAILIIAGSGINFYYNQKRISS
jgi:drug/metabolite transporter (DMT)-like permease